MRISWGDEKGYSAGVYMGVLYPQDTPGVPWNGLVSVIDKGDGSSDSLYLDGQRFRNRNAPSTFSGTIAAFTYPDDFEPYIGIESSWITAQTRQSFGFSYRTNRELHIVYNALTSPSSDKYQTIGDNVNPIVFSWGFTTTPVDIPGGRPSAHLVVMLDYAPAGAISDLEAVLYGDDVDEAQLPDPETVIDIFESYTTIRITDNGDGTWTATGPDSLISVSGEVITIDGAFVTALDSETYKIRSL